MISENLALLKELDLETWKELDDIMNTSTAKAEYAANVRHAVIQDTIQRAIEKLGRQWQITSWNPCGELRYLASISNTSGLIVWDDIEGDSPAEALLAAYIEAIR